MSVTTASIQLALLPSSVSTSPNTPTVTPSLGALKSSSSVQSNTHATIGSATTANINSTAVASGVTNSQQSTRRLPWRRIRRSITLLAKALITVVCAMATYLAFDLAMWSAAKDYRDDCRNQNETSGQITSSCTEALYAVLRKPLGLNMFISSSEHRRRRLARSVQLSDIADFEAGSFGAGWLTHTTVIMLLTVVGATFVFAVRRQSRDLSHLTVEPSIHHFVSPSVTRLPNTWVGGAVARVISTAVSTSQEANSTNFRWRFVRDQSEHRDEAKPPENEWLTAGRSIFKPQKQQVIVNLPKFKKVDVRKHATDPANRLKLSDVLESRIISWPGSNLLKADTDSPSRTKLSEVFKLAKMRRPQRDLFNIATNPMIQAQLYSILKYGLATGPRSIKTIDYPQITAQLFKKWKVHMKQARIAGVNKSSANTPRQLSPPSKTDVSSKRPATQNAPPPRATQTIEPLRWRTVPDLNGFVVEFDTFGGTRILSDPWPGSAAAHRQKLKDFMKSSR